MDHKKSGTYGVVFNRDTMKCSIGEHVIFSEWSEGRVEDWGAVLATPCVWKHREEQFYRAVQGGKFYLYHCDNHRLLIEEISLEQAQRVAEHYEGKSLRESDWETKNDTERFLGIYDPAGMYQLGGWFADE